MNERQVHKFVQRYLETTDCRVVEKSPAHFIVKLSPQADRDLTNRPFYWSFVDRTGADPETMTMLLITDKKKYEERQSSEQQDGNQPGTAPGNGTGAGTAIGAAADAAIGRSFGFVHGSLNTNQRIPREDLHFGSRKLEQLFQSAKSGGSYVCLFQEPDRKNAHPLQSTAYTAWLGLNLKVEFACDMKREEFHSIGVSLATGQCVEGFHETMLALRMTPRLPPNVHTAKNALTLNKAASLAESLIERKLKSYDYGWAQGAAARLQEELATIRHYYEPLVAAAEDEEIRASIQTQFERRQDEIRWQYEPRVSVSAINCGIFYLAGIG
ncbi:YqhG family protein [Paenibacillus xanthanilyticus]|uniref:YqhG family protein n=1 Tax=Paenibacillus xanthanilyticus TaxID=1783531 RepID=A0ABV8K287_9BACL